jgi:hypothetical protein
MPDEQLQTEPGDAEPGDAVDALKSDEPVLALIPCF